MSPETSASTLYVAPPKTYSITPTKGFVGRTYEVVITSPGCADSSNELSAAELYAPAGSGITVTNDRKSACSLTAIISVANDAPAEKVQLWVQKSDKTILGLVDFTISNTLPPGPTPPGLTPQVDIMWNVIPENIAAHNFGRTIAKNYYCVEVVIGNNTGYSLQIVSVGFAVPLTDAELLNEAWAKASSSKNNSDGRNNGTNAGNGETAGNEKPTYNTRFLKIPNSSYRLTRGSLESRHMLYPRSLVLNTITALGPIFTGFTPYFHNINHRGNYTEFINIFSNPLEKGLELVWPDARDVQRNRFDDQVLRDGLILANNISQRTMVFLPKKLLSPYLDVTAVEDLCRHRQTPDYGQCKKDLQREFERTYAAWKNNPRGVMDKLGQLILVGDVISATNRITVTSGPVPGPLAAPPTVLQVTLKNNALSNVPQGEKNSPLEILGSNLTGAQVKSNYDEIKIAPVTSDSNGKRAVTKITVTDKALPGDYELVVVTPGGSVPIPVTVIHKEGPNDLKLQYKSGEAFTETEPTLKTGQSQTVEIKITGKNLKDADIDDVKLPKGGLQINSIDSSSDTELKANVTVAPETPAADYDLKVLNSSGNTATVKFKVKFQ